ncbi:MAG: tetratricopeptide repeat protein [Bacteroidales bacterium]
MKAFLHILISLLLLLPSTSTEAQTTNLISLGYQKLEARELDEAINYFSQALEESPSDTSALSGMIRAHLLAQNHKDAQKVVEDALEKHPNNAEFHLRKGIVNNLRGQYRRAIEDFNRALKLSDERFEHQIYVNRGISYMQDERYEDAIQDFSQALSINPRHSTSLSQRAFSHYRLGNYQEAIQDYNKTLDLKPESSMNFYNRGMAFLRSGNRAKACSDFHQACRLGNNNACRMIMTECEGRR